MYVHSYVIHLPYKRVNRLCMCIRKLHVGIKYVQNPICCEAENATNIGVCIQFPTPKIEYRWK